VAYKIWIYWDNYPGKTKPPYIELCHESIRAKCGDTFEIHEVTSDNVEEYLPGELKRFSKLCQINNKSNFLRYNLLAEHGGIWLDSDLVIFQDLKPLMDRLLDSPHDLIATSGPEWGYHEPESGILFSKKNGKVITKAAGRINRQIDKHGEGHVFPWGTLGPAIIRQASMGSEYIHLEPHYFMPISSHLAWRFASAEPLAPLINDQTFGFMLFNEMFRRENSKIMTMTKEKLMKSKMLIGQIFRRAINE